jgi:hypothetical protein
VVESGIGIYAVTGAGLSTLGPAASAVPGQELIVWATGAGAVSFDETVPPPESADLQDAVQARIYAGGQMVAPSFVGRASCCAGLDQINFQLPRNTPTGCSVPIAVQAGDRVSNFVTIPVAAGGGTCADSTGLSGSDLVSPGSVGVLQLTSATTSPGGTGRIQVATADSAQASFVSGRSVLPMAPLGGCVVSTSNGPPPDNSSSGTPLDAGPSIRLSGPNAFSAVLARTKAGLYSADIPGDPFGNPGEYSFTGSGGRDVGPFTAALKTAPPVVWTNAGQIVNVRQAAGQLITWTGSNPGGTVLITGTSGPGDQPASGSATFSCAVTAAAGSFLIPDTVLLALPPTFAGGVPVGSLSVSSQGPLQRFTIPGLDLAFGIAVQRTSLNVIYARQ